MYYNLCSNDTVYLSVPHVWLELRKVLTPHKLKISYISTTDKLYFHFSFNQLSYYFKSL